MAKEIINTGKSQNKGDGDPLRTAFTKVNANFDELYSGTFTDTTDFTTSIIPRTDNVIDLGSSTKRWSELYVKDFIFINGVRLSGTASGDLVVGGNIVYARDIVGSVFADDSTLMMDGLTGKHYGPLIGDVTGNLTGNSAGVHTGNVTGNVTGNLTGSITATGTLDGDVTGSVFADDSATLVDAVAGKVIILYNTTAELQEQGNLYYTQARADARVNALVTQSFVNGLNITATSTVGTVTGTVDGDVTGSVFGDNSTTLVDGVSSKIVGPIESTSILPGDGSTDIGSTSNRFYNAWFTGQIQTDTIIATNVTGTLDGDITGSVFGDDSTTLVDGVGKKIVGDIETTSLRTSETGIALGSTAGAINQGYAAVAVGSGAAGGNQGAEGVAIGLLAGSVNQGAGAVAISNAGTGFQGAQAIAIGYTAGSTYQGIKAIAVGFLAGGNNQGASAIAIGDEAGTGGEATATYVSGGSSTTLVLNTVVNIVAGMRVTGTGFTHTDLDDQQTVVSVVDATTVTLSAGANGGTPSGTLTFKSQQSPNAVAIGDNAGKTSQGTKAVAVGKDAGKTNQGKDAIAIGGDAGLTSQGLEAIAIGYLTGRTTQGNYGVAIGYSAGNTTQGVYGIGIGSQAGYTGQGNYGIGIGESAGYTGQGNYGIGIGNQAGNNGQGQFATAIGLNAGKLNQSDYGVAIGANAGKENQAANSVAIGREAGKLSQHANSIVINASGAALNTTQASSFVVKPIRSATMTTILGYNATSGEVTHNAAIPGYTNTADLKALVAASTSFADYQTRIAAL